MTNRQQKRAMRSKLRRGKVPQTIEERTDGEVQLGVSVREGAVVMNFVTPGGQSIVLGIPPESARRFALALDEAAESADEKRE